MFSSWFGGKKEEDTIDFRATAAEPSTPAAGEANAADPATNQEGGGFFGFMKGILGIDQLKVEETGENKTDEDAGERKGLFSQMSGYIGKDITSMISLPVWIFEPISFLQVMSEPLQYEHLLQKAAEAEDPLDRLVFLAAFNCALYSAAIRTKKPFNPILGETFEVVSKDERFKFIAEQVSHHPPIGVSETTSKDYTMQLETDLKSKFYGNSTEVFIGGTNHMRIHKTGEHITWGHLVTCCHNIILGSIWVDHYGDLTFTNHTTGDKCVLKFQKAGYFGAGRYVVAGEVFDKEGNLKITLNGKWNDSLRARKVGGEEYLVWDSENKVITNKNGFSNYIIEEVINLPPEYEAILPQTDSRLRADRRALESGDIDKAAKMKHELEEAQRAAKRAREAKGEQWANRYFEKEEDPEFGYQWKFNGKYWDERKERESRHTRDAEIEKYN